MIAALLSCVLLSDVPTLTGRLKSESIVVQAAEVHVGDGTIFKPGVVVVLDGRIVAVGPAPVLPAGSRVVDCGNLVLTAGLVDAACQLGMNQQFGFSEQSSEVIPTLDCMDAIDFYSKDFEQLAREGVTTVYLTPEAASVISSRGAAVKTAGPIAQRKLATPPCVKATLGPETSQRGGFNSSPFRFGDVTFYARRPTTRMGSAWVFREALAQALQFQATGTTQRDPATMRALVDLLEGKVKLRFQAREALDIRSAQRLCDEFKDSKLSFTLEYGSEVVQCLDLVSARKIPVIYGPLRVEDSMVTLFSGEEATTALATPKLLADSNVTFCLTACDGLGDGGLSRQVGLAIRNGLDRKRALRSVTADAAAMIGLDQRVGLIAVNLDADLVGWTGQPFDDASKPDLVLISGRPVYDASGRYGKEIN